ncbi:MAG: sulfite exporter TauE/SafE family protein [Zoogloeaceae bacterium]|nr:sulfite exporter TauE/SafE family protein [Zoogloeaceae bacterium]
MDWAHSLAGLFVGLLVGMTGVGGGALMTPLLVLLFGVAPATAVGTDLWFAALTKSVGGVVHSRSGTVDWEVVQRLCWGSLPAALVTLLALHFLGAGKSGGVLVHALGAVLILTAVAMVFKKLFHAFGQQLRTRLPENFKRAQPALTVFAGALLGVLVSLTSIGAGALGAVMLVYLYPFRMKPTRLVGTDIVHAIPLTIVAGTGHLLMDNVDLVLLATLLAGSIPGILVGSLISTRAPELVLRMLIALALVAAGAKMLSA